MAAKTNGCTAGIRTSDAGLLSGNKESQRLEKGNSRCRNQGTAAAREPTTKDLSLRLFAYLLV
jgi:hypothetical protein